MSTIGIDISGPLCVRAPITQIAQALASGEFAKQIMIFGAYYEALKNRYGVELRHGTALEALLIDMHEDLTPDARNMCHVLATGKLLPRGDRK